MTNVKTTKRALISSVVALLVCFSMLIGTTFAWFTDSVTSANNIITSGNLDIELYYQLEGETSWTKVTETTNVFKEDTLWEPGHTEVVKLKIVNEGSLALKYNLGVNVASETGSVNMAGEDFLLSEFIKFAVIDGENTYTRDEAIAAAEAVGATALKTAYNSGTTQLLATEEDYVTMVVYMPTTVGNEANPAKGAATPTINLGLNLFATQTAYEEDSFNDQYDADAITIVTTAAEAQAALDNATAGTIIKLAPGNYGTLYLRQNADAKEVDISNIGRDARGSEKYSQYDGITIIGADGATVDQIAFDKGLDNETVWSYIYVKNLTVKDVTFSGEKTAVDLSTPANNDVYFGVDGLSLIGCKMTDTTGTNRLVIQPKAGYKDLTDKTTGEFVMTLGVKNLTITGCEVTGAHQVIETRQMENLTITYNTFNGIKARDIMLGADQTALGNGVTYTGTITITGNTSINGEERFIRGTGIGNATLIIKDNTINNYKGSNDDYIKVEGATGTKEVSGNTATAADASRTLTIVY